MLSGEIAFNNNYYYYYHYILYIKYDCMIDIMYDYIIYL